MTDRPKSIYKTLLLVLLFSIGHAIYAHDGHESDSLYIHRFDLDSVKGMMTNGEVQMRAQAYKYYEDLLNLNIAYYNQINDSLFGDYSKGHWVEAYLHRARVTSALGQENQAAINYFRPRLKSDTLPEVFFEALSDTFDIVPYLHDDFLNEELREVFVSRLESHPEQIQLHPEEYIRTKVYLAESYYYVAASGDPVCLQKSVDTFRDVLDHVVPGKDIPLTPVTAEFYLEAGSSLVNVANLILQGVITAEEHTSYRKLLHQRVEDPVFCKGVKESVISKARQSVARHSLNMLRNVYFADTTHKYDRLRDYLMTEHVEYYEKHPQLIDRMDPVSHRRLLLMQHRLGRITTEDALQICEEISAKHSVNIVTETDIMTKFNSVLECAYYVDISERSFEEKREKIKGYCDEIFQVFATFHYVNKMPKLVNSLANVAVYPRIHKYLYPDERKTFLSEVLFFSQPFTRGHSETVTQLALTILNSVIDYQPELLTGMLGYHTGKEVQENPKRLLSFFTDGARFHDLGKTRMPDIIRNEYRQLNDHEFSIIRRHPELGLEFLKVDSSLMKLHDIVLGHHKWYNGKGGYPAYFDNTKSEYHVLIDILTLADCLEAATARLGRNYRKNKHYEDVFKEFQTDAGTRYNPYLVKHLEEHPQTQEKLRELCEKGWEDIYYGVFTKNN